MATEWLTVAATELEAFAQLRPGQFKSMCKTARHECTHHGQLVAKILSGQRYAWEMTSEPLRLPSKTVKQLDGGGTAKLIASTAKKLTAR